MDAVRRKEMQKIYWKRQRTRLVKRLKGGYHRNKNYIPWREKGQCRAGRIYHQNRPANKIWRREFSALPFRSLSFLYRDMRRCLRPQFLRGTQNSCWKYLSCPATWVWQNTGRENLYRKDCYRDHCSTWFSREIPSGPDKSRRPVRCKKSHHEPSKIWSEDTGEIRDRCTYSVWLANCGQHLQRLESKET